MHAGDTVLVMLRERRRRGHSEPDLETETETETESESETETETESESESESNLRRPARLRPRIKSGRHNPRDVRSALPSAKHKTLYEFPTRSIASWPPHAKQTRSVRP